MQERSRYERGFAKHLKRFIRNTYDKVRALELLSQGISQAEVFRQIASNKGRGKSHASGKPENKLKGS